MNKEEMICKNCKYHYKEEISFDYPQSCCDKRKAVIEEWFNCNDFEYGDRYIEQLQQENKILKENAEHNDKVVDKVNWENQLLKKENQALNKKYENAVADYETTMFEKEQLNSLVNSCQEEIRQLKKQLENYKKLGFKYLQDKNNNLEKQQKEFTNYLEDKINYYKRNTQCFSMNLIEEILQKYKSVIGVSDDKTN